MRNRLMPITLKGFKTIRELKDFKPRPLTVLIGTQRRWKIQFYLFFSHDKLGISRPEPSSALRESARRCQHLFARRPQLKPERSRQN